MFRAIIPIAAVAAALAYVAFRTADTTPVHETSPRPVELAPDPGGALRSADVPMRSSVSAPEAAAPASSGTTQIEVVDPGGLPVARVEIYANSGSGREALGTTEGDGVLVARLPVADYLELTGSSKTHLLVPHGLSSPYEESVSLVARPAGRVSGFLVGPNESPVGRGVTVCAYPVGRVPRRLPSDGGDATPFLQRTKSNEHGRFDLPRLLPGVRYTIIAGGAGLVSEGGIHASPGDEEVRVDLQRAYAAVVQLQGNAGERLSFNPFRRAAVLELDCDQAGVARGSGQFLQAALATDDAAVRSALQDPEAGSSFLLFVGGDQRDIVAPIFYRFELPGFQRIDVELEAWSLDRGAPFYVLELAPSGEPLGTLRVNLRASHSVGGSSSGLFGNSTIQLKSLGGRDYRLRIKDPAGENLFESIPVGRYLLKVRLHSGLVEFPGIDEEFYLDIHPGDNELVVDIPDSGDLLVEAYDENGLRREGAFGVTIAPSDRVSTDPLGRTVYSGLVQEYFDDRPYRFSGVPVGTYVVIPSGHTSPSNLVEVTVEPADEVVVHLNTE